jgi:hypothetical protein
MKNMMIPVLVTSVVSSNDIEKNFVTLRTSSLFFMAYAAIMCKNFLKRLRNPKGIISLPPKKSNVTFKIIEAKSRKRGNELSDIFSCAIKNTIMKESVTSNRNQVGGGVGGVTLKEEELGWKSELWRKQRW